MLVATAVFSALSLVGGAENTATPGGNATIRVEAFVIQVNLSALAERGVSPIGEAPHAVSVENILTCLETGQACVIAGAKAASQHEGHGTIRANRTIYRTREAPDPRRAMPARSQSTDQFEVTTAVRTSSAVRVQFDYTAAMFLQDPGETYGPPNLATWEWSGAIVLTPGEPEIAAATQDEKRAVFLLLAAHIEGE
jgi:hypothetical protein